MADLQDLIVVGGGSAGFAAAMRAAQLGGRVLLIEGDRYGGNCMNRACIPSKVLMTAARRMATIQDAERYGIQVGEPQVDLEVLHERKDLIVESLRMGTEQLLSDRGIKLLEGQGKLVARDTVRAGADQDGGVGGAQYQARCILLATGSVAAQPPIEGADLPGVIGTEEAMDLREIPARVAILGSKPWDIELAQYWHRMGSQVTLIERGRQLLPEADREIAQRLGKLLHDSGIAIKRGIAVEAIRRANDGSLAVVLADGKGEVLADRVLAARRLPNSTGLGLRQVGVKTAGGAVVVNERMETSISGIYAAGDVATNAGTSTTRSRVYTAGSPGMWSHKASAEGIVAAENAMGQASKMNYSSLPRCLYTWPEVAWVGLTEDQAEAQGLEVSIGKIPTAINSYAMILDQTAGMIKVIISKKYGKILGAHIMAPGAVDLINAISIAMLSEATVNELMRFIPAHPAIGEGLVDAAMDVNGRAIS